MSNIVSNNNYLKINDDEYILLADIPDSEGVKLLEEGYVLVSDSQIDLAFNLYYDVLNGRLSSSEAKEIILGNRSIQE